MLLRVAPLYLATAAVVWLLAVSTGHAETFGWRIEVRACRGEACRLLPVSRRRWDNLHACQTRTRAIVDLGEAPRGRTLRAWCVSVEGMRAA